MTIKDGDCKSCEHFVKDAYGQFVCEFDGECENMVREMTNEEWFCKLSTEEKAKWIQYVICHCRHCNADNAFLCQFYDKVGFVPCVGDGLVEWLKQPHQQKTTLLAR